jgi:hypothetical protein
LLKSIIEPNRPQIARGMNDLDDFDSGLHDAVEDEIIARREHAKIPMEVFSFFAEKRIGRQHPEFLMKKLIEIFGSGRISGEDISIDISQILASFPRDFASVHVRFIYDLPNSR